MKKVIAGVVLIGLLAGCGPDNAHVADQLEEQLERVLDGKTDSFDHIEIEEGSDAAVIRGHIAALSLDITLLGAMDKDVLGLIKELEFTLAEELNGMTGKDKYGFMAGYMFEDNDFRKCLGSVGNLYRDLSILRNQAEE